MNGHRAGIVSEDVLNGQFTVAVAVVVRWFVYRRMRFLYAPCGAIAAETPEAQSPKIFGGHCEFDKIEFVVGSIKLIKLVGGIIVTACWWY